MPDMTKEKSFYITTTLPYVNAPLHMGHALEFIRADVVARYKRLLGYDVFFNTGTDEHGIKIYKKAEEAGMPPQDFVDAGFKTFKEQLDKFGVSEEAHFIRTTDEGHIRQAQEFWKRVADRGYIYKKNYETKYCVGCESEKTDSELDENGHCPIHPGISLELISEENYFFKYSDFAGKLLEFYGKNPSFVVPDFRFNEIKAFVKNGLQDFSISRLKAKMPWGIEVPGDSEHVMYVWFDALTNYINTLGWADNDAKFERYWINGTPTQYCGKDNTRFQAIMWQAMLMAADLPPSHRVVVNGFVTGEGGVRMSKTLGNVVDPRDLAERYGTDALRYFLLRECSSFEDSPFTAERFHQSYNAGLANGLGNLVSRIMKLAEANLSEPVSVGSFSPSEDMTIAMDDFDLKRAIDGVWASISDLDTEIQEKKPWESKDKEVIKSFAEKLGGIARSLSPFLPKTSDSIIVAISQNKMPSEPLFPRK